MYHPNRFQSAETTIIGMLCNLHPAQSHITSLQSELYNVANSKYITDKDRYTSRLQSMNLDIPRQLPQFFLQRRPYHVKERREQEGMTKTDAIIVNVPYSYRTLFR